MLTTREATRVPACAPVADSVLTSHRFSGATPFIPGDEGSTVSRVRFALGDQADYVAFMKDVTGIDEGTAQGSAARGRPV